MKFSIRYLLIIFVIFFTLLNNIGISNLNYIEKKATISNTGDLEILIVSSFNTIHRAVVDIDGIGPIISVNSFQHSAFPANFGMVEYSWIPRPAINNTPAHGFAGHFELTWNRAYRAIFAATDGLKQLESGLVNLTEGEEASLIAFANFVVGVAYGLLAIMYDKSIVFYEMSSSDNENILRPYQEVFQTAIGYLDEALSIANANENVSVPSKWTGDQVYDLGELAKLANSYKAYYRANMPRTPAEADQVDWNAVIADVDAGLQRDFAPDALSTGSEWYAWNLVYMNFPGWSQLNYFIKGMADQSGNYQTWYNLSIDNKAPTLPGDVPFLIVTPDERFPQGDTIDEQVDNRGLYVLYVGDEGHARPDRGTWRWSLYRDDRYRNHYPPPPSNMDIFTVEHMQLIKAEALYRTDNLAGAAAIINKTRVANGGLLPVDAGGTNIDCVPKLPNGECGNLWEMLKWEKRLESYQQGLSPWYFDARRWGDHMEGTFLQLPVPGKELEVLELPIYTFGGVGGEWAAPVGTYGF